MTTPSPDVTARRDAIVRAHMTAENAYQFDRCIGEFHHPRYEIVPTGEVWDGHAKVGELLLENRTAFPDFAFLPSTIEHGQSAVYVEGRFTGTQLGPWRGLPPTGRRIDVPMCIVFLFEDDRMVCERTYFDLATLLRQLGVGRDPNSLAGRVATIVNHPLVVAGGFLRQLFRRRAA